MINKKLFSCLLATLFLTSCGVQREIESIKINNRGVEALKSENPALAQREFVDALAKTPFDGVVHNNLGAALDYNKDIAEAIKAYKSANEKAPSEQLQFITAFNLGQAIAKQGKVDEALAWYQKALEINPSSAEVKTNIELLLKSQSQQGGGEGQDQNQDKDKDKKDKGGDEQKDKDRSQGYQENEKHKPRPFKGELHEADVKKILGELKQQEQRIRADYNKKEAKEAPREKDW